MPRKINRWIWMAALLLAQTGRAEARVAMTLSAPGLQWEVLPAATFSVDDWKNNPRLWSVTISNGDTASYPYAFFRIQVSCSHYGEVLKGNTQIFEIPPQFTVTKNNTDFDALYDESKNEEFEDDAIALGVLPADTYDLTFQLWDGNSRTSNRHEPTGTLLASEGLSIEITNPAPPVLVVPADGSSTTLFPTFQWDMSAVRMHPVWASSAKLAAATVRRLRVTYTLRLYRGFDRQGVGIPAETAIAQDPVWEKAVENGNSALFSAAEASENLIPGGKYYWYVYAEDEAGYPVGGSDGKSQVWSFTVQFTPPTLTYPTGGEEIRVLPPTFTWTKAIAGGAGVYYQLTLGGDSGYGTPYEPEPIVGASHAYPQDRATLPPGTLHYWKLQTMDAYDHRLGPEQQETFMTPRLEPIAPMHRKASTLTPSLVWKPYWKVSSYEVTLRDQFDDEVWTKTVYGSQARYDGPPLSASRPYKWSIHARGDDGALLGVPSAEAPFTTPAADEAHVVLIRPTDAVVDDLMPAFQWEALAGATEYVITVQDDQGTTLHEGSTADTLYDYPSGAAGLAYDATCRWSVHALKDSVAWGNPSEIATFYTPTESNAGVSTARGGFTDIAIAWEPLAEATTYVLQVSANADLSDPLWTHTTPQTAALYPLAAPPLEPGETYYWRVEGKDAQGNVVGTSTGTVEPSGEPGGEPLTLGWGDLDLFFRVAFPDLFASGARLEGYRLTGATEDGALINPERLRQLLDPAQHEVLPIQAK